MNLVVADATLGNDSTLATALFDLLKNTRELEYMAHQFHWNIVGVKFNTMHEFYEEEYKQLFEDQDEIAEQIRQQGFFVPVINNVLLEENYSASGFEEQLIAYSGKLTQNIALIDKANDLAKNEIAVQDLCARLKGLRGLSLNLKVKAMLGANKMSLEPSEANVVESAAKELFKEGDRVNISGDISNGDYNCRVSSTGIVEENQKTPSSKVRVTIDEIDGDKKVSMLVNPSIVTLASAVTAGKLDKSDEIAKIDKFLSNLAKKYKVADIEKGRDFGTNPTTSFDWHLYKYSRIKPSGMDNTKIDVIYNAGDITISAHKGDTGNGNIKQKAKIHSVKTLERYAEEFAKWAFSDSNNASAVTAEFSNLTRKELENLGFKVSKSGDSAMRENEDGSLDAVECMLYFSSAKDRRSLIQGNYTDDQEFNKEDDLINHIKNKSKATASVVTVGFDKGRYKEIDEESKFFKILKNDCDIRPKNFYAINKGMRLAIKVIKGTFEDASIRFFALKNKGGYVRVELKDKVYIVGYTIYESGKIKVWTRELKSNVPVNSFDYDMLNMYAKPFGTKMITGMLPTWMSI